MNEQLLYSISQLYSVTTLCTFLYTSTKYANREDKLSYPSIGESACILVVQHLESPK